MRQLSQGMTAALVAALLALQCVHGAQDVCMGDDCGDKKPAYEFPHLADPYKDYNKLGISHGQKQEYPKAIEYFQAAGFHSPNRGDVWANIGLTYLNMARNIVRQDKKKATAYVRESLAAFDLGVYLNNAKSQTMKEDCENFIRENLGAVKQSERYEREQQAMMNVVWGKHLDAANLLCANQDDLKVVFSEREQRRGIPTATTMRRLFIIFRVCGVVVLRDVHTPGLISRLKSEQEALFEDFYSHINETYAQTEVDGKRETEHAADRGDNRFELKFPMRAPFASPEFVANNFILTFVKCLLSERIEIDTFSSVTSLPGAANQAWHADVDFLFHRMVMGDNFHLPPQGVVVVTPLVPLTELTGPTEFLCGSHVNLGIDFWVANTSPPITPVHRVTAEPGSSVIFDLRIRHRGTANRSTQRRPIVYLSYVQEWYYDKVNFKEKQTRAFDELPSVAMQKLFVRLDNLAYTAQVEKLAEKAGVDLAGLRSTSSYRKVNLRT